MFAEPSLDAFCAGVMPLSWMGLRQVRMLPRLSLLAQVTFVLSLKLVKSYVLVTAKMYASSTFVLECEDSCGVRGPRSRGQGH